MNPPLPVGAATLAEAFLRAEALGGRPAWASIAEHQIETDRQWSYGELFGASRRIATGLRGLGVHEGERLALVALPSPDYAKGMAGAILAGAAAAPVNHLFKRREMAAYLELVRPSAVLVDSHNLPLVRESLTNLSPAPLLIGTTADVDTAVTLDGLEDATPASPPAVSPDDAAIILHTSGTTGLPKGVVRTHGAYAAFLSMWGADGYVTEGDRVLSAGPLYHQSGLTLGWLGSIALGLPFFHVSRFRAEVFWDVVRRNRITVPLGLPAPIPERLAQLPPGPRDRDHVVRWMMCGAPLETWWRLQDQFGVSIHTGYGSTESTLVTFSAGPRDVEKRYDEKLLPPGAHAPAGTIFPGYSEYRIVRGDGSPAAPGEVGAIQVRGNAVFSEYLHDPERTRAAFTDDAWFDPGDSAYVDERGSLHVLGRTKEMIRRSGENIAPREVEVVLHEHPEILEAAVMGVPDRIRGAEILACIVRKPDSALTAQDVVSFCRDQLSVFKVPRYVEFRTDLPKTSTGKVQKALIVDAADSTRWFDRYKVEGLSK